ncbi:MAG: hypothetical protein VCF25_13365 [Candidatus Poribacteria bacterium]
MRVESIPARPFHIPSYQQISLLKSTQMLIAELPNLVWLLPRQPEENGVTLAPKSALKCGAVPEESFCFLRHNTSVQEFAKEAGNPNNIGDNLVIYAEMILTSRCSWQRGSMAL